MRISKIETLYGAGWPSAMRSAPQAVSAPPHAYSARSAQSAGSSFRLSVTIGAAPTAAARSTASKRPNPRVWVSPGSPHQNPAYGCLAWRGPRKAFHR